MGDQPFSRADPVAGDEPPVVDEDLVGGEDDLGERVVERDVHEQRPGASQS